MDLILASKSPRRQQLLQEMGFRFEVMQKETDESCPPGLAPEEAAIHIAEKKALAFKGEISPEKLLIAADTIVVVDREILGKPGDRPAALEMLGKLSGREHRVITGVALLQDGTLSSFAAVTTVGFAPLTPGEIAYYVDNYRPFDKAGAYGIQEWIGYNKVTRIDGSYTNVVGLPTERLYSFLTRSAPQS